MKIVLIAPGYKPFPPNGWGAVESIVWDYYQNLLKRGHDVNIVNRSNPAEIIAETNAIRDELQSFVDAVTNNHPTAVSEVDGLRAMEVAHLILEKIQRTGIN